MSEGGGGGPVDLEQRLQRLETQNRTLRRAVILSVAVIAIAMTVLARWVVVRNDGKARFRTVVAVHFTVRDSLSQRRGEGGRYAGIVRLTLGGDERTARGIVMGVGRSVKPQVILKAGDGGPGLMLSAGSVQAVERFGEVHPFGAYFYLNRGVPSFILTDSSGRLVLRDSLRLRR